MRQRGAPASKRTVSASSAAPPEAYALSTLHSRLKTLEDAQKVTTTLESTVSSSTTSAEIHSLQNQIQILQTDLSTLRAADAAARTELLSVKAALLTAKTALSTAQDEAAELRRALARERDDGEIRARRAEREARELKGDLEAAEGRVARIRGEVLAAQAREAALEERLREHTGLMQQRAQWELQRAGFKNERSEWEGERAAFASQRSEWEEERKRWGEEREEMRKEMRRGEEERRALHAEVVELKGNIRVFCRVRPVLEAECEVSAERTPTTVEADIVYPDAQLPYPSGQREIMLSAAGEGREWDLAGKARREEWRFGFDRVFPPASTQADLFAEIQQLAQSALDGCVFFFCLSFFFFSG
jgi:kinesin family protein C1